MNFQLITFSKLITAKALSNNAGGGFDAYVYPQWSTIVGWLIFISCIIPIPIVFIVNYIREYIALGSAKDNFSEKPRYIQAFTENNSPRFDWGPKKKINQYGLYSHLNRVETKTELIDNTFTNENYHEEENSIKRDTELVEIRF